MTEIILKIDVEELRSIYFRDNRQRYFFGPETKRQTFFFLLAILTFPFFVYEYLPSSDNGLFIVGTMFFAYLIHNYWSVAAPIYKWKKGIEEYFESVKKIGTLEFQYNDCYFTHIQDNVEFKQEWTIIDRATINDQYIWLYSNTNFLLPKNSMTKNEYDELSKMVMKKVKNVEKF